MRKRASLVLVAILAAIGLAIVPAVSAQAISRETIDLSYVLAHAHTNNGGETYYGDLKAESGSQCIRMERKTSQGNWVTSGFWDGQFNIDPMSHCANELADHQNWQIHGGGQTFGIRIHVYSGGSNVATFCDSAFNCGEL